MMLKMAYVEPREIHGPVFVQAMQILDGPGIGSIPRIILLNDAAQDADLLGNALMIAEGA
ncbi:MAG: hypothetical protein K0B01_10295 [Syntrophobacterales bacterium]|nr:hypothetical protein [Syntrophobacterales bacterium]